MTGPQKQDALNARWQPYTDEEAADLVRVLYGLDAMPARLASERDDTFILATGGRQSHVLKIANPLEDEPGLIFHLSALAHLARVAPLLPVPRVIPPRGGGLVAHVEQGGCRRTVRLLTFLEGSQLNTLPRTPELARNLGIVLGDLDRALESHAPPARPKQQLLWDISHAMGMERLLPHVAAERQPVVRAVLAEIAAILPAWRQLPAQTIHNDFNPFNILVDPGNHTAISGILDFGDMVHAPALNDLATAAAYLTDEPGLELYRAIIAGYASRRPLTPAEIGLLPSLTKARLILTICITEWRAAERPAEAAYILRNHPAANRGLINLQGHSAALLQALVANAAGARP